MSWDRNGISIVIPTYKRPDDIIRALRSVETETVGDRPLEIIVADNDPKASAREAVASFMAASNANIHYIHVPEPGVSNARNGALAKAQGRYILFLDDDMEARAPWASSLIEAAEQYKATLVFGPVDAVMPEQNHALYDYMQPLFCRNPYSETGLIPEGVATGNCLLDRGQADLPSPVFDPAMNQSGGEDDALFRHLIAQGRQLAWTEDAKTFEHVPAHRATLRYVWRRNFAFGQSPTQEAADRGWRGVFGIVKWMGVGAVQTALYALRWIISRLRKRPEAVQHWGRLAQGVGKIFWSKRLSPKLYGG